MAKPPPQDNTICRNRKAGFRFEVLEELECGMALEGTEVKSLRDRNATLDEAYARIDDNEVWLIGCHISPYVYGNTQNHEPTRKRKLLLRRDQIRKLKPKVEQRGLTLVPLRIYFNDRGLAKMTLALCKGKSVADKRQSMKARDDRREMDRAMRSRK